MNPVNNDIYQGLKQLREKQSDLEAEDIDSLIEDFSSAEGETIKTKIELCKKNLGRSIKVVAERVSDDKKLNEIASTYQKIKMSQEKQFKICKKIEKNQEEMEKDIQNLEENNKEKKDSLDKMGKKNTASYQEQQQKINNLKKLLNNSSFEKSNWNVLKKEKNQKREVQKEINTIPQKSTNIYKLTIIIITGTFVLAAAYFYFSKLK